MTKDLEDLEKQFILNEDMEHEDIKELITRITNFCKVDNKGFVLIHNKQLRIQDKIMLVLSARYLANKLQQKLGKEASILELVKAKEMSEMLKEKDTVVIARLKELKDDKKIISQGRGIYKIASYAIKDLLNDLEGVKNERRSKETRGKN